MTPPAIIGVPLLLGTETKWGKVASVGIIGGERYYWMIDNVGITSMMPADVVEAE